MFLSSNDLILTGDFNLPDINWSSLTSSTQASSLFSDFVYAKNLTQLVHDTTHIRGGTLDLVLSSCEDLVQRVLVHNPLHTPVSSDHYMVSFQCKVPSNSCIVMDLECIQGSYLTILRRTG